MAYSTDLRKKVMEFLQKGRSMSQAREAFGISEFTVNKWKRLLERTGSPEDEPRQATFKKLDPEKLEAYVGEHPDAYLKEIGDAFGCSGTAVFKALERLKITRKKNQEVQGAEGGAGRGVSGGAGKGFRPPHRLCGRDGHRHLPLPRVWQAGKSVIAPMQYDGPMDSEVFESRFEAWLLPAMPEGSVVVMDNASFHRKGRLRALAEKAGYALLFLPPYSPELNPIENFWAWLKGRLRKILPLFSSFDEALHEAFQVD